MVPEGFRENLRTALGRLHNYSALEASPLGYELAGPGPPLSGPALREMLISALEQLKPAQITPATQAEARRYSHLTLRYVEGRNRDDIARYLMVSPRQASRDHELALDTLAVLLWARRQGRDQSIQPRLSQIEAFREGEDQGVSTDPSGDNAEANVLGILHGAIATLDRVLREHRVALIDRLPDLLPPAAIDPGILRQGFLHLLSYASDLATDGEIVVTAADIALGITTQIQWSSPSTGKPFTANGRDLIDLLDFGVSLLQSRGGEVEITDGNCLNGQIRIILAPVRQPRVLIVDDNPDVVALFRRYLRGQQYRLIQATTANAAVGVAIELRPDIIILDVMLPSRDGWDVLRELQAYPALRAIPVIVCSVLPELALARQFGVIDFLVKPVTQASLIAALERWCRAPRAHPIPPESIA